MLSPRPAEARMSRPTGQIREGDRPLVGGLRTKEGEDEGTPLLSRPRRNFRASYMLTAFLSTLFTITDWETLNEKPILKKIIIWTFIDQEHGRE